MKITFAFFFLSNLFLFRVTAQNIHGKVLDQSGKPLAFATIKFHNSNEGVIANLDGKFLLNGNIKIIEVSHTGYTSQKLEILPGLKELLITLKPLTVDQEVVIIKATGNKLKRILNTAIANRSMHNPDNYDWYQCNVY
ncbi:MAG: carboxypeptidase-like regulatory domain-containing protein, partial [Ferruginibacter sp.]